MTIRTAYLERNLIWAMRFLSCFLVLLLTATLTVGSSPTVLQNFVRGSALKCAADLCGGLPCEVWKSSVVLESISAESQNRPAVNSIQVLRRVLHEKGPRGLWSGCSARMVEGCFSGAVLLSSKETIRKTLSASTVIRKRLAPATIGFISGACGGACQAIVMTPCSLLVTATAAGAGGGNVIGAAREIWTRKGAGGFYRGSGAVAARQATNWFSRQGITELVRPKIKIGGVPGEILAGCLGGTISCWNTPFEVARIYSQTHSYSGEDNEHSSRRKEHHTMFATMSDVVKNRGIGGLFAGIGPRIVQSCYQTVFLVTIPRVLDS
mmetsp:Transcript_30091/g.66644  ORF Transcript_30091/g.66644 Transcript_30091/m.66644 type:complete len:323 (+) Transcript_30091:15-983(+)